MPGPIAGARRLGAPERRELVFRAAGELFGRQGYAGTTLDQVAAAAGVTKPIVYRHFESKKALYLALLAKHRDDLPTFLEGREAEAANPDEVVREILGVWLDYVRLNGHSWLMLFRDTSGDEEIRAFRLEVSRRAREVLAAFIAERSSGTLPDRLVEPTAEMLTSGLAGLALWWIDHPDVPKEEVAAVAARMSAPAFGSPG
jgi:AcrR family transcriptional regulator